jgi:hypothetical protein
MLIPNWAVGPLSGTRMPIFTGYALQACVAASAAKAANATPRENFLRRAMLISRVHYCLINPTIHSQEPVRRLYFRHLVDILCRNAVSKYFDNMPAKVYLDNRHTSAGAEYAPER